MTCWRPFPIKFNNRRYGNERSVIYIISKGRWDDKRLGVIKRRVGGSPPPPPQLETKSYILCWCISVDVSVMSFRCPLQSFRHNRMTYATSLLAWTCATRLIHTEHILHAIHVEELQLNPFQLEVPWPVVCKLCNPWPNEVRLEPHSTGTVTWTVRTFNGKSKLSPAAGWKSNRTVHYVIFDHNRF
jgi:hypothetical protein